MNVDIDKLSERASSSLHAGEEFRAKTAGKIAIPAEGGEHIVRGFIGATDQRIIVLISPTFDPDDLDSFTFAETAEYKFNRGENKFYFTAAGQHFVLTDVLADPDPNKLADFVKEKKFQEKVTVEVPLVTRKIK